MEATATPRTQEVMKPEPGTAKVTVDEVTLRKFELSDVDAMMAWASDPRVAAVCRWEPYESTEPLLAFIRDVVLPHPWFRAICLRGVATAAVKRTVAAVFGEVPGLERVEALVDVANPASQRVLEKAGFTREAVLRKYGAIKGVVRDMVMSSFIDTDPVVPE